MFRYLHRTASVTTKMQEIKHLTQGSSHPPLKSGLLRLYNMRFCPFGQRSLLILEAKKIPYDLVNVNLMNKPDWFLRLNPRGQVPTLELEGGHSIAESLVVSELLEETYPDLRALYPRDVVAKAKDRMLIDRFSGVIGLFHQIFKSMSDSEQSLILFEKLIRILTKYETELKNRGSVFFAGNTPGMVDYSIWPWFEREGVMRLSGNEKLNIFNNHLPELQRWCDAMKRDDVIKKWILPAELHAQFLMGLFAHQPNYDLLVNQNKL